MSPQTLETGSSVITSAQRAVGLLRLVADQGSVSVTEVASAMGVHKSTASRLLATLAEEEFLERDPLTRRFHLGTQALRLSATSGGWANLSRAGHAALESLARATGATTNLGVLSGMEVVHIDQANDPRSILRVDWVGKQVPPHCTSMGKALLAYQPAEILESFLSSELVALTPGTITDRTRLREELAQVRERGFSTSIEEYQVGLNGVGAPVRDRTGAVVAAVCAYGPSFTISVGDLPRIAKTTRAAAAEISARLGAEPGSA